MITKELTVLNTTLLNIYLELDRVSALETSLKNKKLQVQHQIGILTALQSSQTKSAPVQSVAMDNPKDP